ncbi:MAG: glycosyltransferase family 1 protein [Gemmatimonadota bacterium]
MRITLVTDTYLPEVNGVTTVLSTMRAGLMLRGHHVQVICPAYPSAVREDAEVVRLPSISCPGYPALRLSFPWHPAVARSIRRFAPDIVHAATEGPLGSAGRRFALRKRIPFASSYHTDFPRYAAEYLGRWAVAPTREHLRRFHSAALFTQTPSAFIRDELKTLGVPSPVVWGRGVDAKHFTPDRRSAVRRAAADTGVRVLHVGRLAVEKATGTLIEAFQRAHLLLGAEATFCIAGEGPRSREVRERLPFVRHLGFLDRQTLADLYADADLFLFPSATETCGLVALEAMACGLPVIGARAGGVAENIRHGLTGLLVAPGHSEGFASAIVELVRDCARREAMSQAARAFAVACDWQRELDDLVHMYQCAVFGAAGRGGKKSPRIIPADASVLRPVRHQV